MKVRTRSEEQRAKHEGQQSPVLVLYHQGCPDGFCAAWLLHHAFPEASFRAVGYGDMPPDCTGTRVFIVDFSYPLADLLRIADQADALVVIDHHQTAQERLAALAARFPPPNTTVETVFDVTHSGGWLTWNFLRTRNFLDPTRFDACPWLVRYTEDRDLWRWALPHARAINAALASYVRRFAFWDQLFPHDPLTLVAEGEAILRMQDQTIAAHVARAGTIALAGHAVPCVNATTLVSEIGHALSPRVPFAVCYHDDADGLRHYHLRSDADGLNVAVIAQQYGGGGHQHAAGFTWQTSARLPPAHAFVCCPRAGDCDLTYTIVRDAWTVSYARYGTRPCAWVVRAPALTLLAALTDPLHRFLFQESPLAPPDPSAGTVLGSLLGTPVRLGDPVPSHPLVLIHANGTSSPVGCGCTT